MRFQEILGATCPSSDEHCQSTRPKRRQIVQQSSRGWYVDLLQIAPYGSGNDIVGTDLGEVRIGRVVRSSVGARGRLRKMILGCRQTCGQ